MISREEAIRKLSTTAVMVLRGSTKEFEEAIQLAIEALSQPERPKGRWIPRNECHWENGYIHVDVIGYTCSVCGSDEELYRKFCPECGADMRGEE